MLSKEADKSQNQVHTCILPMQRTEICNSRAVN